MTLQHVRYALRTLLKNPGFTSAAVLCLALGIGATSAIFSVVNAVLLRPLPYAESGRMVRIFTEFPEFPNGGLKHFWMSPPEYLDIKRESKSWDAMEGWVDSGANLAGESEPVRATASFVTGGMFNMLGVQPIRGRLLTPADDSTGSPLVAVISYGLWQRAYGGDPTVLGRDIHLNGNRCTVVGIMPKSFVFPPGEVDSPELWSPLQIDPANPGGRSRHFLSVIGRLKPAVTLRQARDEMSAVVQRSGETHDMKYHGFDPKKHPVVMNGFQDEVVKGVRPAMLVLLGAVAFVLLISCVNVANLLLARAEARRREIAIRKAIGAGLANLLTQFVTEGVLLSIMGGIGGLLLAYGGLKLIVLTNAGMIPRTGEINIDSRVLLVTLLVAVLTGVAFGLAPVMHLIGHDLYETLKSATGRATATAASGRFRSVLVSVELALALVLLIGAGLMIRAFWRLQELNTGVDPRNVVTLRVALPGTSYKDAAATNAFWSSLHSRLKSLPGIQAVALSSGLPPMRTLNANDTQIEGWVPVENGPQQNVDYWNTVTPGYCEAFRLRVIEGRCLDDRDGQSAPATVMINQTMARLFWGNRSSIGRRVRPAFTDPWRTIVGVVADVKNAGVDQPTGTEMYLPYQQPLAGAARQINIVVRTQGDPMNMVNTVRSQVGGLDPSLPVSNVRTMDELLASGRSRPRFLMLLLTLFSGVSLILAAVGIYGVVSYSVSQRTGEFGLRMALGASTPDVVRLVLNQGMMLAIVGIVAGALGAVAVTRFLGGFLFGISSLDAATFIAMAALLFIVMMLACYVPARRATKVDPMVALRYE